MEYDLSGPLNYMGNNQWSKSEKLPNGKTCLVGVNQQCAIFTIAGVGSARGNLVWSGFMANGNTEFSSYSFGYQCFKNGDKMAMNCKIQHSQSTASSGSSWTRFFNFTIAKVADFFMKKILPDYD